MRCDFEPGAVGICVPCDELEIPYDGIDNDCLAHTPDRDLDGDGDNWVGAAVRPGTDCDDDDALVSARLPERCADQRDNDCDGEVDELDCADQDAPVVMFSSPSPGAILSGSVTFVVLASDDYGLAEVVLQGPRGVQLGGRSSSPYRFEVDTTTLEDGPTDLEAIATDVAGTRSYAQMTVVVDNRTGPVVQVLVGPDGPGRYGGDLLFELVASDPSGVAGIAVVVDGSTVASTTTSTLTASFDSRGLTDGAHEVVLLATDGRGATSELRSTVRIDNTPPTVAIVRPAQDAVVPTGPLAFEVVASDPSGILRTWVGDASTPGSPLAANVELLDVGWQTITASASDVVTVDGRLSGNVGTAEVTVRVQ